MTEPIEGAAVWRWPKRFAFCFLVVFIVLATLPMPFAAIPYGAKPFGWLTKLWIAIVPIVGAHLFHVDAHFQDLGSGDTVFHYVQLVVWAAVACVVALLWSSIDRNRSHYEGVGRVFLVFVRYALALSMVSYGAAKVIPVQFPRPALDILLLPYGQSTPYRLAWTFMGASPFFQMFSGWAELISAFLLTIRRTSLFGALLAIGVLLNVAAFNFAYGIAAKIQVLHLLTLAVIVVYPHLRRLIGFLVLNRPTTPAELRPLFAQRKTERAFVVVRTVAVIAFIAGTLLARRDWQVHFGDLSPRSPLRGIWNVDVFEDNGVVRPPLVTDAGRWRRMVFDGPLFGTIYDMDDTRHWFRAQLTPRQLLLTTMDAKKTIVLLYSKPDPRTLVIDASIDAHRIHAICHRVDEKVFPLVSTPFRWSAEYPIY